VCTWSCTIGRAQHTAPCRSHPLASGANAGARQGRGIRPKYVPAFKLLLHSRHPSAGGNTRARRSATHDAPSALDIAQPPAADRDPTASPQHARETTLSTTQVIPSPMERSIMDATGVSLPDARKALFTADEDADRAAEALLAPPASAEGSSDGAPCAPSKISQEKRGQPAASTKRPPRTQRAAAPAPDLEELLAAGPSHPPTRAAGNNSKGHEVPGHPPEDQPPRKLSSRRGKG